MRFQNIEVSGIEHIVINRTHHWRLFSADTWAKCLRDGDGFPVSLPAPQKMPHKEMMRIVNILKKDRRYRMWIHMDTLNIVRK
jgi:hypothetical protein